MTRPAPLSLYAYLQLFGVVEVFLNPFQIPLSGSQPLQALIVTGTYSIGIAVGLLCAITAFKGSRWTRPLYITCVVAEFLSEVLPENGGARVPLKFIITSLVPLVLLFSPSVSAYLKTRPQIRLRWPGLGRAMTITCCTFSLGLFFLTMNNMFAATPSDDNLAKLAGLFAVPAIVLWITVSSARYQLNTLREIGLALMAGVLSNILLAADFATLQISDGRQVTPYLVGCWLVLTAVGAALVAHASRARNSGPST
ncbi:hypothetical protein [Pandoraea norimbergensis]|nr:hypothetical protein [Pandoraea norimbergensis]ALS60468.3 hypothetical protein AT302_12495 [Pandoraea norimbergensis]